MNLGGVIGAIFLVMAALGVWFGVGAILTEDLQGGGDAWGLVFLVAAAIAGLIGFAAISSARRNG